jgi:hypothetical protein
MKQEMKRALLCMMLMLPCLTACRLYAKGLHQGDTVKAKNGALIFIGQETSSKMKLIAQVKLMNLECSMGDAFRLSAGVGGDYFLPKFASFHASYINAYFNLQKFHANTLNKSDNQLSNFSLFEIGGRFHIMDKAGRAKHKLIFSSSTSGNITTTKYLKAKLPCRRILALRGGLYRSTAAVSTDMNEDELKVGTYGAVKTMDGSVFANVYFTNSYTTGFYLGLSDIINMSVVTKTNVTDYEGRSFFSGIFREVYADVILASTSFDGIKSGGLEHAIEANTAKSFQTQKIGWRVGKSYAFSRKAINVAYNFELGDRPGVSGKGLYFSSGVSLIYIK